MGGMLTLLMPSLRAALCDCSQPVLEYTCPKCGATYNTLQASALIDFRDGQFHCEHCQTVLVTAEAAGAQGGQSASARRERLKAMRELQVRRQGPALMSGMQETQLRVPMGEGRLTFWSFACGSAGLSARRTCLAGPLLS